MSSGDIAETRAAASSIASGMPSRRWQISTTEATFDSPSVNAGSTVAARSANRRTASVEAASSMSSGASAVRPGSDAADRRAGQRLQLEHGLARGPRAPPGSWPGCAGPGACASSRSASVATPSTRCSALSSSSSRSLSARNAVTVAMRRDARDLRCAEGARDLGRDLRRVAERRQLREPDAVRVAVEEAAGGLQHQAGLAGPAGADEGDEPVAPDERRDLGQLLLPADEARQLDRQVGAARAQRAKGRELPREVVDDHLVDLLGPVDVAEAVPAEVDELDRRRQPIAGEDGRDRRADDLAAVPDRRGSARPG